MACVVKRRGRWVVDWRDHLNVRHWKTCGSKEHADQVLAEVLKTTGPRSRPTDDSEILVTDFSEKWLKEVSVTAKAGTAESYRAIVTKHVLPEFGTKKVRTFTDPVVIRDFLVKKRDTHKLKRNTVAGILNVVRTMLSYAVDHKLLASNAALGLGKKLKLRQKDHAEPIKAMDREQLAQFLDAAGRVTHRYYALLLCLARTGMRLSEGIGLQWHDVDFEHKTIQIERAISRGRVGVPKSGRGRTVDMSRELVRELSRNLKARKEEALKLGRPLSPWVFTDRKSVV